MNSQSEIAQLRTQIEREIISMRLGLHGLAVGIAKHEFIEAKMHKLGTYKDQLAIHVGKEQANQFSCQTYIQVMDGKEQE
jgi:hypothetical protein